MRTGYEIREGSAMIAARTEAQDWADAVGACREIRGECRQCGTPMNPAERMLGPVCGKCCRANHRAVAGR